MERIPWRWVWLLFLGPAGALAGSELRASGVIYALHCDGKGTVDAITDIETGPRFWRLAPHGAPHPLEVLLEKNRLDVIDRLGPDGRSGVVSAERGDTLVGIGTGSVLVDPAAVAKHIGLDAVAALGAFSANGRWTAWSASGNDRWNRPFGGVAFFDRDTKKISDGPRGLHSPNWVGNQGRLFCAQVVGKRPHVQVIADRKGTVLFPKPGDPALVPSSVSQNISGDRIAFAVRTADGEVTLRLHAMPGFRLLGEYRQTMSPGALTPDGRFLVVRTGAVPGPVPNRMLTKHSLIEVETGATMDLGDRLAGDWVQSCSGAPGRFAVVVNHEARGKKPEYSVVLLVELGKILDAAGLPRFADAKEAFAQALLGPDGNRAWRAATALAAQKVTRAEVQAALGRRPSLEARDRTLLGNLPKRFTSVDAEERESAAAAVRALIVRTDEATYRAQILPTLAALRRSEDAELRGQSRALMRYQPGRSAVSPAALAARLEGLAP